LSTDDSNEYYNSRILIKFDLSSISSSIASNEITNPRFDLVLYETEAQQIPIEYTLYGYSVSES
jgi:hypothetical protein